ncbi:sexual differentiation process protein isp4 [Colletotrichum spaethianum]|uniref:Sexual differentiation process protein isp4 n=1 Tax=Colletotrichum spaethianum TaxID=700344 RepID=A0AA37UIG4_9PEZI|nr:sexual differentiation process protein isp4 [Colletotrichum spaethianum]GKT47969.1 sexual differentiation process protein isp4 [Colletotrichum spaethianum]
MAQRPPSWAPSPSYSPLKLEGGYVYESEPARHPHPMSMNSQPRPVKREHQPEYYQPEYQQAQYYRQDYHHHHEYHQPPSPVYHQSQQYQHYQPLPHQPAQLTDPYRSAPMPRYPQEPPRESPTSASTGEPYDEYQAAREAHFLKRNQPPQMPQIPQGAPRVLNDTYQGKVAIPFTPPSLRIPAQRPGSAMPVAGASWSATSQSDRLKIEDLLSGGGNDLRTVQRAPEPDVKVVNNEYEIFFRQQPMAARCCGYGERDRRVIDPPPIVQLKINNPDLTPDELYQRIHHPAYVVHCSIWNEEGTVDSTNMPDDVARPGKRIMGSLVSSPFVGQDENGEEGCFFCFPDMSVRTPGHYRLKFVLVVVDPAHRSLRAPIRSSIMSAVFTVYSAKDFPGMQASTPLTKRLKEQGCLISIKKGNEKSGGKNARRQQDDSEEEEEEEEEAGTSAKRKKTRKQK